MIGPEKLIANFERYEKTIYDYCRKRIDGYFDSTCYSILKNRMSRLDGSIDMKSAKQKNQWNSKIQIPYGHEAYIMTRATLKRAFAAEPLASLQPIDNTDWENATNMQDVLNQNLKSTRFRDLAFQEIQKTAARYGSCPVLSYFEHRPQSFKRTVQGQFGLEQKIVSQVKQNVWNRAINPLNYFQNQAIAQPEESDFQGWVARWNVSKLIGLAESMPDNYIKANLSRAIAEAKAASQTNEHYHTAQQKDYHGFYTDIEHLYIKLNFEGNEEDETLYYIEIAGDHIIRIQDNPNDYGITGISIFNIDKRHEYWWANTPVEKTLSAENYANIMLSMTADNMFNAAQNIVFYPKGKVDVAAINDRHKNGGFIPMDAEVLQGYRNPFMPYQRQEISTAATQYMMGELKEALQRTQAKPDVQRRGVAGGPQNNTATAYQGMQAESDALQYDYLSEFAVGIKDMCRADVIMFQQRSNDWFQIRPNPKEPARVLHKNNILGDYAFQVESSMTKNTQTELMKYQNALTWIMNMQGTGNPALQRVNMDKLFRATLKKFDLDVDMDEVYPEQPAGFDQQQAGSAQVAVPGMPGAETAAPTEPSMAGVS